MTATEPPAFESAKEYRSRIADVGFWRPYISRILKRHDLSGMERGVMAGHNATYPTFLCGDVVVKLFGHFPPWRKSHAAECSALHLVANDPKIAAPQLLASGSIFRDSDMPWPYLVTGRMPGVQCWRAELSTAQLTALAVDLGRQIRRVHALQPIRVMPQAELPVADIVAAACRSSFPRHLIPGIRRYLARLRPFDHVLVHSDLVDSHIYVEGGCLSGIIDWGDAAVIDRHYELAKLFFDTFRCDKELLGVFLAASEWPVGGDFAHRTLALALHRQAVGFAQHHTFDVFHRLPSPLRRQEIGTLDDLAAELLED